MSHPAGSRKRQTRGGKVLGLFVAVWLNLALAPCAMAIEAGEDHPGDHPCPHCPPADTHGHHDMHAGMQAQAPCADDLSDWDLRIFGLVERFINALRVLFRSGGPPWITLFA